MSNVDVRWLWIAIAVALSGCGDHEADDQPDGSADTDADTDTDVDAGPLCADGVDVMQPSPDGGAEIPTGIEECADESWHRYAAISCTFSALDDPGCEGFGEYGCPPDQLPCDTGYASTVCITPCTSDADCASDEACLCKQAGSFVTHCVPVECRIDADCGSFECGVSRGGCTGGANRLVCRTADDDCHGYEQCGVNGVYCGYSDASLHWECFYIPDCE